MGFQFLDSRDLVADFYPRYEQAVAGNYANLLSMMMNSDREIESYGWLGQASGMREWIGNRQEGQLNKFTQTVRNKKYEDTLYISVDDLRRDKTGQIAVRISDMAAKAADHPNQLLAAMLNSASGAGPTAYDGVAFYATTHTEGASGTQVNLVSSTQVPAADVVAAATPTATEMATILVQAVGYMYTLKDDKGDLINGGAKRFHILTTTAAQYAAAAQAIALGRLASGADNPTVALATQGISFALTLEPRITNWATNTQFGLSILDGASKPFIDQIELPLQTSLLGAGSEEEFKNDRHAFGLKSVRAIAPGFWQKSIRITLS